MSQSEPRVAQWREPKTRMSLKLEHFYEALRVSLGDYDFKARRWARLTVSGKPNAQLRSEDSVGEDVIGVRETWCALDCDDGRAAFLSELYKTSSSRYGTSWTREAELRLGPTWVYDDFAGIAEGTTRANALALVKVLPMTNVGHTTGAHITDADILGEGLYWEQDSQKASHPLDVSAWAAEAARVGDAVLAGLGIVAAVTDVTAAVLHTESTVLDEYVRHQLDQAWLKVLCQVRIGQRDVTVVFTHYMQDVDSPLRAPDAYPKAMLHRPTPDPIQRYACLIAPETPPAEALGRSPVGQSLSEVPEPAEVTVWQSQWAGRLFGVRQP